MSGSPIRLGWTGGEYCCARRVLEDFLDRGGGDGRAAGTSCGDGKGGGGEVERMKDMAEMAREKVSEREEFCGERTQH